jgi:hypothetical protein
MAITWKTSGVLTAVRPDRLTAVVSLQEVDRDGEVIDLAGLQRHDFERNPVMLADHQHDKIIGSWPHLWDGTLNGLPALFGEARRGTGPMADAIWEQIIAGHRPAFSVGLSVHATGPALRANQRGVTIVKSELLEISSVAVPSCRQCLLVSLGPAREKCACAHGDDLVREALRQHRVERFAAEVIHDPAPLARELARALRPTVDREVRRQLAQLRGGR